MGFFPLHPQRKIILVSVLLESKKVVAKNSALSTKLAVYDFLRRLFFMGVFTWASWVAIHFSFLWISFFLLTLIPSLGHLSPVMFNEDDVDVIPGMDISPCHILLSLPFFCLCVLVFFD